MDWPAIADAGSKMLSTVFSAFLLALAAPLGLVAVRVAQWLAAKTGITLTARNELEIQTAAERSILSAADRMRDVAGAGAEKKALAIELAAQQSPKFKSMPPAAQQVVVEAAYTKLRPSLQTPSSPPPSGTSSSGTTYQPITPSMLDPAMLRGDIRLPTPSITPKETT